MSIRVATFEDTQIVAELAIQMWESNTVEELTQEIIEYVEEKTGAEATIDNSGEDAPYNGEPEYSICTDKAKELGYQFTELKDWIYGLLDYYIQVVEEIDKVDNGRFH